jgi:hypothetical protein
VVLDRRRSAGYAGIDAFAPECVRDDKNPTIVQPANPGAQTTGFPSPVTRRLCDLPKSAPCVYSRRGIAVAVLSQVLKEVRNCFKNILKPDIVEPTLFGVSLRQSERSNQYLFVIGDYPPLH